jgi:hypothetical protein
MRSMDDVPYVTDPSGATTKYEGNKADLLALCAERGIEVPAKVTVDQLHELLGRRPARVKYGSPSGFGGVIEDPFSLAKYTERLLASRSPAPADGAAHPPPLDQAWLAEHGWS